MACTSSEVTENPDLDIYEQFCSAVRGCTPPVGVLGTPPAAFSNFAVRSAVS